VRRIYDSPAVRRDDDDPHKPNERDQTTGPEAMRTVPSGLVSRLLVPQWLQFRALSVTLSTPQTEYDAGRPVPFAVEIENTMPFPVTVPSRSPVLWTWAVDGLPEASHVYEQPPDEKRYFRFGRSERKRFTRRWQQMVQTTASEWEPVDPGEYTLSVDLNVDGAAEKGLTDETVIRIRPD
jgi:hypothetical protein